MKIRLSATLCLLLSTLLLAQDEIWDDPVVVVPSVNLRTDWDTGQDGEAIESTRSILFKMVRTYTIADDPMANIGDPPNESDRLQLDGFIFNAEDTEQIPEIDFYQLNQSIPKDPVLPGNSGPISLDLDLINANLNPTALTVHFPNVPNREYESIGVARPNVFKVSPYRVLFFEVPQGPKMGDVQVMVQVIGQNHTNQDRELTLYYMNPLLLSQPRVTLPANSTFLLTFSGAVIPFGTMPAGDKIKGMIRLEDTGEYFEFESVFEGLDFL